MRQHRFCRYSLAQCNSLRGECEGEGEEEEVQTLLELLLFPGSEAKTHHVFFGML